MLHSPRRIASAIGLAVYFFIVITNWESARPPRASAAQSTHLDLRPRPEFMFNQEAVAKKIGASPNIVGEEARQALYDLVVESRNKKNVPGKGKGYRL